MSSINTILFVYSGFQYCLLMCKKSGLFDLWIFLNFHLKITAVDFDTKIQIFSMVYSYFVNAVNITLMWHRTISSLFLFV